MSDLIERQAAIDGKIIIQLANGVEIYDDEAVLVSYLKHLPSAQPEIIRCKDCKNFIRWRSEEEAKEFGQLYLCGITIFNRVEPEDFCSHAERRT